MNEVRKEWKNGQIGKKKIKWGNLTFHIIFKTSCLLAFFDVSRYEK